MNRVGNFSPEEHGITVSQLQDWLACREKARYRLLGVQPIKPMMALIYGNVVHPCLEETYAIKSPTEESVVKTLRGIEQSWKLANPRAGQDALEILEQAVMFAEAVMPSYFKYWKRDAPNTRWLALERGFVSEFELPDGTKVKFRGYRDGVFERGKQLWLFETKTKARVDEGALIDRLSWDIQLVGYLLSLWQETGRKPRGAVYNVIRRPQLRQKKKETFAAFGVRVAKDVKMRPDFYFQQFEIIADDLEQQRDGFIQLLQDYTNWCRGITGHYRNGEECENKYGTCPFLPLCAGRATHLYRNTERLKSRPKLKVVKGGKKK